MSKTRLRLPSERDLKVSDGEEYVISRGPTQGINSQFGASLSRPLPANLTSQIALYRLRALRILYFILTRRIVADSVLRAGEEVVKLRCFHPAVSL